MGRRRKRRSKRRSKKKSLKIRRRPSPKKRRVRKKAKRRSPKRIRSKRKSKPRRSKKRRSKKRRPKKRRSPKRIRRKKAKKRKKRKQRRKRRSPKRIKKDPKRNPKKNPKKRPKGKDDDFDDMDDLDDYIEDDFLDDDVIDPDNISGKKWKPDKVEDHVAKQWGERFKKKDGTEPERLKVSVPNTPERLKKYTDKKGQFDSDKYVSDVRGKMAGRAGRRGFIGNASAALRRKGPQKIKPTKPKYGAAINELNHIQFKSNWVFSSKKGFVLLCLIAKR